MKCKSCKEEVGVERTWMLHITIGCKASKNS